MKKFAVIALILLLVVSLGTSVFLLLGQRQAETSLKKSQELTKKNTQSSSNLQGEYIALETQLKNATNEVAKSETTIAQYKRYKKTSEMAQSEIDKLKKELADAASAPSPISTNEIALLSELDSKIATLDTANQKMSSLTNQLADAKASLVEARKNQKNLAAFKELKMTPEEIIELKQKRLLKLKTTTIPASVPKAPGKLKKPTAFPAPPNPILPIPKPTQKPKDKK